MVNKCYNPACNNILHHIEGRRKKKYCSIKCRNKVNMNIFLQKPKELKTKRILVDEYNELIEIRKKYESIIAVKCLNKEKLEHLETNNLDTIQKELQLLILQKKEEESRVCPSYINKTQFKKLKEDKINNIQNRINEIEFLLKKY